jgi:hypothetical protein
MEKRACVINDDHFQIEHHKTTCPNRFSYEQTSTLCIVELTTMLHTNDIKHKKLIALSSKNGGYSMILLKADHRESIQQEHDERNKRNRSSF